MLIRATAPRGLRRTRLHHGRPLRHRGETTVERDRLQGHLPESDDLLPRRHGEPPRYTDHRQRQHAQNRRDFLLLRQRRHLHHRKRRAHRPARAGEAQEDYGAVEGEVKGEMAQIAIWGIEGVAKEGKESTIKIHGKILVYFYC